jgi:mannosyltransferase
MILSLMAFLGVLQLDRSFWGDEAWTVLIVSQSWDDFADTLIGDQSNMWLYYLLMRPWIQPGWSEWLVRAPSVLFSIASVGAVYILGKRLFSRTAGLAAALLLSINGFHLTYAQEARSYSLLVLLSILAGWCFLRAIERPTPGRLAAYVLIATLAFYTHLFAIQLVMAHALALAFLRKERISWRRLALAFTCIALLCFPLLYLAFFVDKGGLYWVEPLRPIEIYQFLLTLTGGGGVALFLVYCVAVTPGFLKALHGWHSSGRGRSTEWWPYAFLLTWIVFPIVLTALVSLFMEPIFVRRFLIFLLPALVLLAGNGLASFRPRRLAIAVVVVLVGLSTRGVMKVYAAPHTDWRAATAYMLSHARPGDGLVFEPRWDWSTFELYRHRYGYLGNAPKELPRSPSCGDTNSEQAIPDDVSRRYSRIWHLRSHLHRLPDETAGQRAARQRLTAAYGRVDEKDFSDIRLLLYSGGRAGDKGGSARFPAP